MTRTTTLLARTLSLGLFCGVMAAQSTAIHLDAVALDSAGHPVTGLTQASFQVLDNGSSASIRSITEVSKADATASALIVFDTVNTGVTYTARMRDDLVKYLRQNDGQLTYPTALAVLTGTSMSISPSPTKDGNALADAVAKIDVNPQAVTRAGGSAGDQQRFNISMKALDQILNAATQMPGRKLVLWLAPGWSLMSGGDMRPSPDQGDFLVKKVMEYSNNLRQNKITLYSLNTNSDMSPAAFLSYQKYLKPVNKSNQTDFADLSLQVLAIQTGGLVLKENDLGHMLNTALQDAGDHYEIVIDAGAANKAAPFHAVTVRANQPGVTVRTRSGYYAQ